MIDATKSPLPAWRRYATFAVLAVLILVAGYFVWSKELHKSAATGSAPAPATASAPSSTKSSPTNLVHVATPTPIPGGIPISTRNPFGG